MDKIARHPFAMLAGSDYEDHPASELTEFLAGQRCVDQATLHGKCVGQRRSGTMPWQDFVEWLASNGTPQVDAI